MQDGPSPQHYLITLRSKPSGARPAYHAFQWSKQPPLIFARAFPVMAMTSYSLSPPKLWPSPVPTLLHSLLWHHGIVLATSFQLPAERLSIKDRSVASGIFGSTGAPDCFDP